jgi:hypothetical protein
MNTKKETVPEYTVEEVIKKLRPLITDIVKEVIVIGPKSDIETSAPLPETSDTSPEASVPDGKNADFFEIESKILEVGDGLKVRLTSVESLLQEFTHKEKINKELHEELQKYRNGLRKEIVTPLLKHIVRECNRISKLHEFYKHDENGASREELFNKLLNEFDTVSFSLLELLNDYDIEAFEAKEGDTYLAKEQKITGFVETEDNSKNGAVASCENNGFRDMETGRLLLQAEVKIYKSKDITV